MLILREDTIEDDAWHLLEPDQQPSGGDIIVAAALWQALTDAGYSGGRLGLRLAADHVIEDGPPGALGCDLIAIEFPTFTDGRGYSLAATLRRRGFLGDLRAIGEVQRDQVDFLRRSGFSSFAAESLEAAAELRRGLQPFRRVYQPAADGAATIMALRRRARSGSRGERAPA